MKATTKHQVMEYLQWSSEEYEQLVFKMYHNWCIKHGVSQSVIQQLMANASINKWFMNEFEKCEQNFIATTDVLPNRVELWRETYKACIIQIIVIYPKPLLDRIKPNPDFITMILTNTPLFYSN